MRHQKKIGFGAPPIQDYKVYSPCRNNKPSTESLDSTVWLSLTFHHRGITVGVAPHPHGNPVRRDPVPAVLP